MTEDVSPALLREVKVLIIDSLNLEDLDPDGIDDEASLVGDGPNSLGLDSIDFLELAMAIEKRWSVKAKAGDSENEQIFRTVQSLAQYVARARPR
jgi:acyl carrier protein